MFELKYDILDDLDARTTNTAERAIASSDENDCREYTTPQEYYRYMARVDCTHLFSLTVLDGWMIDLKRVVEEIRAVAENYFDDCPPVMCVYNPWEKVRSLDKINEIVEEASQEVFVNLDDLSEYNYEIINIRIPIKMDDSLSKQRRILKMINFLLTLRKTYFRYHKAVKFRNLCYSLIYADNCYSTKQQITEAAHWLMLCKFKQLDKRDGNPFIAINEDPVQVTNNRIKAIVDVLDNFFNGDYIYCDISRDDIDAVVRKWWQKHYHGHL